MSLASIVEALAQDRDDIRDSLIAKGIEEAADHGFSSFDEDIDSMVKPEGTITVTENGTYDVTEREGIIVDVYTVEPIDSPEVEIGDVHKGASLQVVWNTVENAICYTLERKHGDDGEWTVIRRMAVTDEDHYTYTDADIISGDEYSYRVYAISDGSQYGNSMVSNVASAIAPYGGRITDLFALNDYCEDVTGGWIVEPYPCEPGVLDPAVITPYVPQLNSNGEMEVYRGGSSTDQGAIWIHTVNPITFRCNETDIFEAASFRCISSEGSAYIRVGFFRETDDGWEIYTANTTVASNYRNIGFVFREDPASPGVYSNIPAGDYYVGFVIHTSSSAQVRIANCSRWLRTWNGVMYDTTNPVTPEMEEVTGGYNESDVAYVNTLQAPVVTPEKTIKHSPERQSWLKFVIPGSISHKCGVFVTGNMVDIGGHRIMRIDSAQSYYTTSYPSLVVAFLDENHNVVDYVVSRPSYPTTNITLPDSIKYGGSYYIAFEMNSINDMDLYNVYLISLGGGIY